MTKQAYLWQEICWAYADLPPRAYMGVQPLEYAGKPSERKNALWII
jgi:hypothetical protein